MLNGTRRNENLVSIQPKLIRLLYRNGPVFEVFEKHFTIIYGTQGRDNETLFYFNRALNLANQWFLYSNGNVSILSDQEALEDMPEQSLILLGGPAANLLTAKLQAEFPVKYEADGKSFVIGDHRYDKSRHLGLLFIAPRHHDQLMLIASGTSLIGDSLAMKAIPIFTG